MQKKTCDLTIPRDIPESLPYLLAPSLILGMGSCPPSSELLLAGLASSYICPNAKCPSCFDNAKGYSRKSVTSGSTISDTRDGQSVPRVRTTTGRFGVIAAAPTHGIAPIQAPCLASPNLGELDREAPPRSRGPHHTYSNSNPDICHSHSLQTVLCCFSVVL